MPLSYGPSMQLPKRRHQTLQIREDEGPLYVTKEALKRLEQTLQELERERPQVVEDLSFARQKGDLSENAEYQDARSKLSRIDSRIFGLKEKLKRASIIEAGTNASGSARIGSTVVLDTGVAKRTYVIVGPQESDPSKGRISHVSPLGQALLNKTAGEAVQVETPDGTKSYTVVEVR